MTIMTIMTIMTHPDRTCRITVIMYPDITCANAHGAMVHALHAISWLMTSRRRRLTRHPAHARLAVALRLDSELLLKVRVKQQVLEVL